MYPAKQRELYRTSARNVKALHIILAARKAIRSLSLPVDHHQPMPKGAASKGKKPAEKKGGDKGKGKSEEAADKGGKVRYMPYPS